MKKISIWKKIGMVAIAAAMVVGFVGCGGTTGGATSDDELVQPTIKVPTSVTLSENSTYNYQGCIEDLFTTSNEYKITKGDKITVTIEATSDVAIPATTYDDGTKVSLQGVFVDNTEAAGWWTVLTDYAVISSDNIAAGDTISATFTLTAAADTTSASNPAANKFFIMTPAKDGYSEATLTFTKFEVSAER